MPHLFVNRQRQHSIMPGLLCPGSHLSWEWFSGILYLVGGILLIAGSVLFLPKYAQYAEDGIWLFIAASICYTLVCLHDSLEVVKVQIDMKELLFLDSLSAAVYTSGSVLFIIGSILLLPDVVSGWILA